MKKILSYVLIVLGAAALVLAIALPTYVVPKGKVLPLNAVSTTGTNVTDSVLLDSAAVGQNKPLAEHANKAECKGKTPQISCFIGSKTPLQSQRFTVAQEPSNDKTVTLEVGTTLFRTDRDEPRNLLNATVERITLDRETQMPVDEAVSTIDLQPTDPTKGTQQANNPGEGFTSSNEPFVRSGIQYQFPMGTDRKSYPYFDYQVLKSKDIDFVEEEEQDGEKVYHFRQTVDPTELYPGVRQMLEADGELSKADEGSLAALRLKFPAAQWGLKKEDIHKDAAEADKPTDEKLPSEKRAEENDEDTLPEVEMSRYYTVNRDIWVQPDTGVIVNGSEEIWQYYAQDQQEAEEIAKPENREAELKNPQRTATFFPGKWNDDAKADQMAKAKDGLDKIHTMGTIVPWILGIIGIIFVIGGFFIYRRS